MRPFERVAVDFASALVAGEFERARSLLAGALQTEYPAGELQRCLLGMSAGYAEGRPMRIQFDEEVSLLEWPARQPGDVGWAYVGIWGEDFVEAVSVVVREVDGKHLIREIEWGRP